ncbi:MAG: nitrite reductase small subunit NirD [Halioglobus sp.]
MSDWKDICHIEDIIPNSGRCALYEGQQIAIFRVRQSGNDALYAVGNYDPLSGANVISRGIVGSQGEQVVVASPVYKQHFCLSTGDCMEEDVSLKTWRVRLQGDRVQLAG